MRFAQQGCMEAPHAWHVKPPFMLPAQTKPVLQFAPQHACPLPPHISQTPPPPPPTHPRPELHIPFAQQA